DAAAARAGVVLRIETALAQASLDRVSRRDPAKVYNKMTREQMGQLTPSFSWDAYLAAVQAPSFTSVNVAVPAFVKGAEDPVGATSLDDWQTYLRWHVLHATAPLLPAAFVNENF